MSTETEIDISTLRINGQRLWDSLMELAKIGATEKGGVCRLTLTGPNDFAFVRMGCLFLPLPHSWS